MVPEGALDRSRVTGWGGSPAGLGRARVLTALCAIVALHGILRWIWLDRAFDHVVFNPPYMTADPAELSPITRKQLADVEGEAAFRAWVVRAHRRGAVGRPAEAAAALQKAVGLTADPAVRAWLVGRR